MKNKRWPLLVKILLLTTMGLLAQKQELSGIIKGQLVDADTQQPLIGANVVILNTMLGAATDGEGSFVIVDVPVGSYNLSYSYIGYKTRVESDVIVRPRRSTTVLAELSVAAVASEAVQVSAGYFSEDKEQPVSITNFSREEIRRAPGAAGDISRIVMSLPAIAKVNDQSNSLIVRGGSPIENSFFIDNIEIPNINHFPTQGASGGPIGLINVDFIREVDFYSGGFSAAYGDRLSSVMAIDFREGNRDAFDAQLDLNFAGFGAVAEGPLGKQKGSWMLSVRRSYLDMLVKAIDVGSTVAPRFGDYQGKVAWDLHPRHRLTLLSVWGDDHNNPDQETAVENDMQVYGKQDIQESTNGLNWRALWGKRGYSNTAISYTRSSFREDLFETNSGMSVLENRSREETGRMRNVNHLTFGPKISLDFGAEIKRLSFSYDNKYGGISNALGDEEAELAVDEDYRATKSSVFLSGQFSLTSRLGVTVGLRGDYFSYNENGHISPRLAVNYQLSERTALNAATGVFYQQLPLLLLGQSSAHKNLRTPLANHYILGIRHLLTENTRLTAEVYQKDYRHFPLNPSQPGLFVLDELFYRYGFFMQHEQLNDNGQAFSRGAEIMIQKKLAEKVYGMASAAWFRSRYRDGQGEWHDRVFDNRFLVSLEGGYKPNANWEFSLRWIYAGGVPYTPFDLTASQSLNREVLDANRINGERLPDYHSLNVRFDRRFHFQQSNLVFYLSVWNAYNRKNIAGYFWNGEEGAPGKIQQWGMLPIFGLEFEF